MTQIVIPLFPSSPPSTASGPTRCCSGSPTSTSPSSVTNAAWSAPTTRCSASRSTARSRTIPGPDIIVFPGGVGTRPLMHDERVLDWVRTAHETTTFTTSVCTGSLVLAAAGLLDGLTATTHWSTLGTLAEHGAIPTSDRVVEHLDRRIITAAGVSSGIDMALRLVEILVDRTAAEACQLMIEYDPQPPFDSGSHRQGERGRRHPGDRVRPAPQAEVACSGRSDPARCSQTAVEQNVSPRAKLDSVVTSPSSSLPSTSTSAPSMPLTMPRSTAQMTGCSVATSPNGQWLLMIRSWSFRPSACAANPWAVERVGHRLHRRAQRSTPGVQRVAGQSVGHRPAVLLADLLGDLLGLVVRQPVERPSEQRQQQIVAAHREVDVVHLSGIGDDHVTLRRTTGTGAGDPAGDDLEISTRGELVEMVAGHVGVHAHLGGDHRGGDTLSSTGVSSGARLGDAIGVIAGEQVDRAPRRITERVGDRRHGCGERRAGRHRRIVSEPNCPYPRSGNSVQLRPPSPQWTDGHPRHRSAGHRGTAAGRGPRTAPFDRRPRHGPQRRHPRRRRGRRAHRAHRARLPAEERDPAARVRRGDRSSTASTRSTSSSP